MDGLGLYASETRQRKPNMCDITYMQVWKSQQTSDYRQEKQTTDEERQLVVCKWEEKGEGDEGGGGINHQV